LGSARQRAAAGGGWWDLNGTITGCVAAYQPKGAADYADSKINLANPGTYNVTDGTAYPTWNTATGWTFNGSTQYLDSGITPENDQSWSGIVRFANSDKVQSGMLFGVISNSAWFLVEDKRTISADEPLYANGTYKTGSTFTDTYGVLAIAGSNGYINASLDVSAIGTGGTTFAATIMIGGRIRGSTLYNPWGGDIIAIAFYDVDISGYISDLTAAMNAL
jgi:hypothetical protein